MDKPQKALLEIYHSRPVVPTRRIALGKYTLNDTNVGTDTDLTLGGLLIAAVVGRYSSSIHPDLWEDLERLFELVAKNRHISQPCLRFRLQTDKIGLAKSSHSLSASKRRTEENEENAEKENAEKTPEKAEESAPEDGEGEKQGRAKANTNNRNNRDVGWKFELALNPHTRGSGIQQILGALYAAQSLPPKARTSCIGTARLALSWWGTGSSNLIAYLLDNQVKSSLKPKSWALNLLDIETLNPSGAQVQRHFRQKLWNIHPDRGGNPVLASELIQELAEARKVLLASNVLD